MSLGDPWWFFSERVSLPGSVERGSVAIVSDPRDPILAYLDHPDPDSVVPRNPMIVSGWALDRSGPLAAVLVSIDGEFWAGPRLGLRRPDVAEAHYDVPGADVCG